jgi:hypothetical protein
MEEGFGMPIIEAVSCNRVCITLKDAKIPYEVSKCSWHSELWELEDNINGFLESKDLYDDWVEKAYNNSKKFRENYADKILKVLEEVNKERYI